MAKTYTKKVVERIPFRPKFAPSVEQVRIFSHTQLGGESLHIGAAAGSGKSTTLAWEMANEYNRSGMRTKGKFMAFNKEIVEAMEANCARHIDVSTAHSSGYKTLARRFGRLFMPQDSNKNACKLLNILKDIQPGLFNPDGFSGGEKGKVYSRLYDTSKLIDMLRLTLTDESNPAAVMDLMMRYNMEIDKHEDVISLLPSIFAKMIENPSMIDFVDMMWLPIRLDLEMEKFDTIYLDEVQDFNNLMIQYSLRMLKDDGVAITCGDRNQSIYGFAGANSKSIDVLREAFDSEELPLNTCYRCAKSIIELAQTIVPSIMPFDGNPDGIVDRPEKLSLDMPDGSMILSRRNANLIRPCFELIKQGRKAIIKGKDIGANLVTTIKKHKGATLDDTCDAIAEYTAMRIEKLSAKQNTANAIDALQDTCDVIKYIAEDCKTTDEMINKIQSIFSESTKGITLSSIHRSKGLEADHVTIVDYARIRLSNEKMTDDDHIQERNLNYVAVTRAKNQLDLIV